MMSIMPLDQVWVDANFKEVQLRDMRIGQPVELIADAYGKSVVYHGTVAGLGVGTGSAFALLPAQNASGNWIKVVQRVPVRIALDPKELAANPLRVGLSMEATRGHRRQVGQGARQRIAHRTPRMRPGVRAHERRGRCAGARHHRRQPGQGQRQAGAIAARSPNRRRARASVQPQPIVPLAPRAML